MRGQQDWEALTFVSAEYGLKCLVSMGLPNDKNGALGSIEGNTQRMRQMEDDGGAKPPSLCVCVCVRARARVRVPVCTCLMI